MTEKHSRSAEMDIIRGLGIILVVVLHVGIPSAFWSNFFNLFHMAIFFFSAGWCFNGKLLEEQNGCLKFVARKVKSLYIPYVLFNGAMYILNNFFIRINIYTDKQEFLEANIGIGNAFGLKNMYSVTDIFRQVFAVLLGGKYGEPQLGGATWFLRALFIVTIVFFVFLKLLRLIKEKLHIEVNEIIAQLIFAAVLLGIGQYVAKNGINNYYQIFTCASIYFIYVVGWIIKKVDIVTKLKQYVGITGVAFFVSFGLLIWVNKNASIAVNANSYTHPFWLVCGSVFGSILCMSIAIVLQKGPRSVWQVVAYIGKNSLSIMMFQFLAFKIITFIQIQYYNRPAYLLAAFPTLDATGIWRWLYMIVGVCIPLLFHAGYKAVVSGISKARDKSC